MPRSKNRDKQLPIGTWVVFDNQVVRRSRHKQGSPTVAYERRPNADDVLNPDLWTDIEDPLVTVDSSTKAKNSSTGVVFRGTPHRGQIIGGKYLREGFIEYHYESGSEFHTGASCRTIFVYRVSIGFINREVYVAPEDALPVEGVDGLDVPYFYNYISDQERQAMSDILVGVPRDELGRFI